MAKKKDPTQITLREAADAYNARGAGQVARFGAKGGLKQYGDMPLVEAFTPDENGVRPIDTMFEGMKSQGAINSLQDDLRLISKDVNRKIFNSNPQSPALNLLPGLEANDPQTFNIFDERISAPKQTEIAIIVQNKEGWSEFMQQLDSIRQGGGNDAVIADAIYVNLQTGYRGGAIAGLTGAEYKVDRGTIEITPQTKATPDLEKRTGAQKKGGARGTAIPQDVPLNEQAHARLQQRLTANQENPGIRAFIEGKIKAGKAAPIFVIEGKNGKFRQVKTDDMTEVLSRITTSTPIIKDNLTNKEFNTLVPDDPAYKGQDKKGKFGAPLLRNVFANVAAYEVGMPDRMLDFLQGRSLKSGAETRSKTAKSGYLPRPRGTFYPAERDAAQTVGNWFDSVQGVTVTDRFNFETDRVTSAKYGIPGMFDQPVAPAVPSPVQAAPVEKPTPTNFDELFEQNPELRSAMEKAGFEFKPEPAPEPEPKSPSKTSKVVGEVVDKGGKVLKGLLPVGIGSSAIIASREAEAQGDTSFVAGMKGVAAGASELIAPPGMAFSDREFREDQRATTPGGSGLGPRTDVAPQTDALGYIKPEFAMYPMKDAPRESFLDTKVKQP